MPACLRVLGEEGRLCAIEGALLLLPSEIWANVLNCSLLHTTSDCTYVYAVSEILAFWHAGNDDKAAFDFVKWFPYDFKDAAIVSIPDWQTKSMKRGLRGDSLPRVAHAKVVLRYV